LRDVLFTYDAKFNLVQVTHPIGQTTTNRYDARGISSPRRIRRATRPVSPTPASSTRWPPITDPKGNTTAYRYDSQDNLRAITYPT